MLTGKEAKLAWANGEIVQIRNTIVGEDFYDLNGDNAKLGVFDLDFYEFRLKPQTITLNGVEVPAPFKPKAGERYYHIYPQYKFGYDYKIFDGDVKHDTYMQFGAWRTEDEIKQVVPALRSIFKGE